MKNDFENTYGKARTATTLTNALVVADLNDHNWDPVDYASARRIKLVHYGRLSTVKGTDIVLELYSRLLNDNFKVSCLVAGSVSEGNIREKISELENSFPDNFAYIQGYHHTDLPQILFDCDFFLFPSKYENEAAPLVVYEAQFNGLVCFTSKAGSLESIVVEPGRTVEIEDWLATITNVLKTESVSSGLKTQDSILLKKKEIFTTMETEASDGRILLEKLISLMLELEPNSLIE
jgi:glycosyltransferase involved in cell wall biosynthesis